MSEDINKIKRKLNSVIKEYGLNSKKALQVSQQLDLLISKYYKNEKKDNRLRM